MPCLYDLSTGQKILKLGNHRGIAPTNRHGRGNPPVVALFIKIKNLKFIVLYKALRLIIIVQLVRSASLPCTR